MIHPWASQLVGKKVRVTLLGRILFEGLLLEEHRINLIYSYPANHLRVEVLES